MDILSSCLALLPIVWLVVALVVLKIPGHWACVSALVVASVLALTAWGMPPVDTLTSALEGFASALWPIILVIIAAIFTYNLTLKTGAMEVIKGMLSGISTDKRVIILLIGWCFGGFLEGMAGFGTAIAIPASMLGAMGMNPILACVVCMIANVFPTAFGSVGIPTVTLASVTGLEPLPLAFTTALQMAPFMILVPFLMVAAGCGGFKALKGVVGITFAAGLSFTIPELVVSCLAGPELTVIVGCVFSLGTVVLMARARRGKPVPQAYTLDAAAAKTASGAPGMGAVRAWLPFILIFVFLLLTSKLVPPVNELLGQFKSTVQISTAAGTTATSFSWVNTPGIIIFIAAIIGGLAQKATFPMMGQVLLTTLKQMSRTIITILSVLAVAKIMAYSGMISDMANLFVAITGPFYPFVAPIIAALGAFVTGSGTSTEVLLGNLQSQAAVAIGASQYWLAAANSLGAGLGKVLSPQCIATAAAAVGLAGQDSALLRAALKWILLMLVLACLVVGLLGAFASNLVG